MKMAWPWPGFMDIKHIVQVLSKDLEECFDKRSPEDDGVGVVGFRRGGEEDNEAASDNLPADNGSASSMVFGS